MRLVRMAELCNQLGIPRRTFNDWVNRDPELAVLKRGPRGNDEYWIKLERLAGRPGIHLIDVYALSEARWVRACDLARVSGISRWTIRKWCLTRPGLGKRIGRNWWVDLNQLGASDEQIDRLVSELGKIRRRGR